MSTEKTTPKPDERETAVFTTPKGKELKIKTYLTGREQRSIRNAYTSQLKSVTDENGKSRYEVESGTAAIMLSEDALLKAAVVSYDNSTEDVFDRVLDAPQVELKFILEKCNALSQDPK